MYVSNSARCDTAFVTNYLARAMVRPTPETMREIDRVFVYIAATPRLGLTFEADNLCAIGAADASWESRHSTLGWCIKWQSAAVSWGSRKQKTIALSSCEAELIALSEAAKDVVFIRKLIGGLNGPISEPTELLCDSKSATDVAYNPEHFGRVKHVERRWFYVRDMVEKMEIRVPLVSTVDNWSDFFTKPLKYKDFKRFRNSIMNIKPGDGTPSA